MEWVASGDRDVAGRQVRDVASEDSGGSYAAHLYRSTKEPRASCTVYVERVSFSDAGGGVPGRWAPQRASGASGGGGGGEARR
jgi:hypothetical protein